MPLNSGEKVNVLLEGPIGTGKTSSLKTIVEECNRKLFVLATEPGIHTILGKLPAEQCHWKYVTPASTDWETLIDNATKVNSYPMDALQKLPGMNKKDYLQFVEVLNALANFTCDRTGEEFGPVDQFETEVVLACDGLSGLSKMAMDLVVGAKPIKTQPEWGVAQDNLRRLLDKLTGDTKCSFVLCAHTDRKEDKITGGTHLTVSTLGQALAPDVPKFFDEVVFASRRGDEFKWSTVESNIDLKSRMLPLSDDIEPTFRHFFGEEK